MTRLPYNPNLSYLEQPNCPNNIIHPGCFEITKVGSLECKTCEHCQYNNLTEQTIYCELSNNLTSEV